VARKDVLHNAREIERYLETLLPKLEPGGGIPDNPMNRKARGSSRPPVSDYVMRLWRSNPYLNQVNDVLKRATLLGDDGLEGRPIWHILSDCLFDHTAIRRWKAEGGINEKRFYMLCMLMAQRLADKHDTPQGAYRITIYIEPTDEPERQRTRQAQKANTRYTQRRMVEQLEEVEEETGYRGQMAMEILSERKQKEGYDWSPRRIKEARTVINAERRQSKGDAA
jgi:hypothetical protein